MSESVVSTPDQKVVIVQLGGAEAAEPIEPHVASITALLADRSAYARSLATGLPIEEAEGWLAKRSISGICLGALATSQDGSARLVGFEALAVPAKRNRYQRLAASILRPEAPRTTITQLAVDPAWRERGIGSMMLLKLAIMAESHHLPLPTVTLNRGNQAANWYRRLAFNHEREANPKTNVVQLAAKSWTSVIINYASEKGRQGY